MAKVKVTAKFQILDFIDRFVDGAFANSLGKTVVTEAKRMISEGQSPVRGYGRFPGYSETYKGWIKSTQAAAALDKKVRPVNLDLTGEMLDGYDYELRQGNALFVGMVAGSYGRKKIAGYHQEGSSKMPQRRLVPGEGEEWAVSIMRSIRDAYGAQLEKLIRQSNKKS